MMTKRRALMTLLACATLMFVVPGAARRALAEEGGNAPQPYTDAAFDSAQKAGKPILIDTYATWCDVCSRQAPIIDKLRAEPQYKDLVTLRVNFDTQKDVMRKFNARVQSTLIAFIGTKEVGRSVGETQPEWIDDLLSKTLVKSAS